ncbi:MAG TPA: hypothetical protein VFM98_11305 [Ramlibacter sp.]|uniref:hypothetical protein n=1 Tax=Ramlibacter sp. TaxID=1917967 RepID=UPI002D8058F4|nr:hypothetical protein [Ramlibacter sp.]HET8746183.1 hypothetical protein [Ramlibacter sp.]
MIHCAANRTLPAGLAALAVAMVAQGQVTSGAPSSPTVDQAPAAQSRPAPRKKRVKYVPPEGFGGHHWGELRSTFTRLPANPLGVGAAFTRPVERHSEFICKPVFTESAQGCDMYTMIMTMSKSYDGGGFYVLSEYSIEGQGFRYGEGERGILLHPVVYQFCANWDDTKKVVPAEFDSINKFCGVRMLFQSETAEQLRKLPADHETRYDRMLSLLMKRYGKPDGFLKRGRVIIETEQGDASEVPDRKFRTWRWCPAPDREMHTSCKASVVLTLNPATGVGTVLYSTPLVWEYAYARKNGGFRDDRLFKTLHARK